ncbi:MAG: peptidoglycan-binding protein [Firmicutes bacterium]|nr:peptidoglycan-binding protein [Bacillota bacterium]
MRVFSKGDRGDEIVDIQLKLSTLGYKLGPNGADGCFTELTEESIKQFQASRGLSVTGIVDEETWRSLVEATYKLGDRFLYLRSPFFRGDDVRELQLSLNTLGFNTGKVDGIYGETTERAVREFQRNYGLPSDGIFGPSTFTAIRNLRHLLENKASAIFPDPHRHQPSAISVFRNRKIAVGLVMEDVEEAGLVEEEEVWVSRDLGLRLGNLLELLGANVTYIEGADLIVGNGEVDIYVGLRLNYGASSESRGSIVIYNNSPGNVGVQSQTLAEMINEELARSLGSHNLGIRPSDLMLKAGVNAPAVLIKPLFITNPNERALLSEDVFRQKIAVAVFDGIKSYLKLYQNFTSATEQKDG